MNAIIILIKLLITFSCFSFDGKIKKSSDEADQNYCQLFLKLSTAFFAVPT